MGQADQFVPCVVDELGGDAVFGLADLVAVGVIAEADALAGIVVIGDAGQAVAVVIGLGFVSGQYALLFGSLAGAVIGGVVTVADGLVRVGDLGQAVQIVVDVAGEFFSLAVGFALLRAVAIGVVLITEQRDGGAMLGVAQLFQLRSGCDCAHHRSSG